MLQKRGLLPANTAGTKLFQTCHECFPFHKTLKMKPNQMLGEHKPMRSLAAVSALALCLLVGCASESVDESKLAPLPAVGTTREQLLATYGPVPTSWPDQIYPAGSGSYSIPDTFISEELRKGHVMLREMHWYADPSNTWYRTVILRQRHGRWIAIKAWYTERIPVPNA